MGQSTIFFAPWRPPNKAGKAALKELLAKLNS
jgi:hypothetical protein